MVFGDKSNDISLNIEDLSINKSTKEKLPEVRSFCKKAGQKPHTLSRISLFLATGQLKRIMKAFILS